jgi:hypothetical protein
MATPTQPAQTQFLNPRLTSPPPGATRIPPAQLELDVIAWAEAAISEAEADAAINPNLKLLPRLIQYLSGNQWPSRATAYGSSRPVSNKMFRQYWELISLLTDGKPESRIKVYDSPDAYSQIQGILGEFLKKFAATVGYQDSFQNIVGFGLLGRGVGKIQWNHQLAGGMGDVELVDLPPNNVFTLGGDGSFDTAECIIEREIITMEALRRQYGDLVDGVEPDTFTSPMTGQTMKPSQLSQSEWARFSPIMRKLLGKKGIDGGAQLYPMVKRYTFWLWDGATNQTGGKVRIGPAKANWSYEVKPGGKLYPRGRVIVVAGRKVMDDTCNPYFHGKFPFIDFTPLRGPWSPEGMSLMGQLIGPQDILNRIFAGLLETVKAALLPSMLIPKNSASRADIDNMSNTVSGTKLEYNAMAGGVPTYKPQPPFPQLSLQFLNIVMREMDQTSGAAAVDDAAQKEQIPSKDTMEMIQNSRSSVVRIMGRALERFMNRGGQLVIANMLQFYSAGHRVAILGEQGLTPMDFSPMYGSLMSDGMAPEDFVRKFEYSIRPGSALDFEKDTRVQMALMLRKQGDLSYENMFTALDANIDLQKNREQLIQEARLKAMLGAAAAAMQPAQGKK